MNTSIASPQFDRGRKQLNGSLGFQIEQPAVFQTVCQESNYYNIKESEGSKLINIRKFHWVRLLGLDCLVLLVLTKLEYLPLRMRFSPFRVPGSRVSSPIPVPQLKYETTRIVIRS